MDQALAEIPSPFTALLLLRGEPIRTTPQGGAPWIGRAIGTALQKY